MTLDDDLILWQIDLLRHDAWLRKELRAKLTKTQQEALAVLLQSANLSGMQLREMRNIIQQGYNAAGKWLSTSLEALMPVAGDAVADIYTAHTGEVFPVPDHYTLPLVDGASVEEWMTQAGSKQAFTLNRLAKSAEYSTAMSAEIREALARGDAHSDALVRTATATAAGEANLEVMRKSGKVKWLQHKSHLDSKTTLTCRARHNKRWDAKTLAPDGHDYEFKQPPLHWNCRSIIKPLLDDHKDAEDDYDFDEWLEKMPPAIQDKALGKGKAEVWRKAKARGEKITVADLLEQNGRELSLEALRAKYPPWRPQQGGTAQEKARYDIITRGQQDGKEHAALLDKDGNVLAMVDGGAKKVSMKETLERFNGQGVSLHHNHPASTSLSMQDVMTVADYGVSEMVAYGTYEDAEYRIRPIAKDTVIKAETYETYRGVTSVLRAEVQGGRITKTHADVLLPHLANILLDKKAIIHYEAVKISEATKDALAAHRELVKKILGEGK